MKTGINSVKQDLIDNIEESVYNTLMGYSHTFSHRTQLPNCVVAFICTFFFTRRRLLLYLLLFHILTERFVRLLRFKLSKSFVTLNGVLFTKAVEAII